MRGCARLFRDGCGGRSAGAVALLCWLALGVPACRGEAGLEGTWRYDRSRFDELTAVAEADREPRGFEGLTGDNSERATRLAALHDEAAHTVFVITADIIRVVRRDEEPEELSYRVVSRADDTWQLAVEEGGATLALTATLSGRRLTLVDEWGAVRYVLRRSSGTPAE